MSLTFEGENGFGLTRKIIGSRQTFLGDFPSFRWEIRITESLVLAVLIMPPFELREYNRAGDVNA